MKEIVESGRIGKVLSSSILASMSNGGATEVKNVRYFLDREVGGNVLTIRFGHAVEFITCGMFPRKGEVSLLTDSTQFWASSRAGIALCRTGTLPRTSSTPARTTK